MKRILSYFSKENSIRGASILLIVTLTISNILGLLRDRFLTKNIATYNLDIYYASFRIPDLIFNFLILGAITSAFIPIFSDFRAKGQEKEGFKVTNMLLNLSFLFVAASGIILAILMPWVMPLVVPKFDAYRMSEAIRFARLLMLTPIFFSFSYILGGMLNSYKRFFAYSLAPLFYNLSIIFGAAFLAPRYGTVGVIYAVIAGSALHFLVQLPSALRLGFRFKAIISFTDVSVKKIIRLMIPRTISMGANQIMLLVYTAIASALAAGSISAFNLANNIQTVPVVVLGTSFATAIFPTLALAISHKEDEKFSFYLNRALRSIGYLLIPSTAIFFLLRAQIVRLILGSGKFSWDDTKMTAMTLGFFSLSILAQGLIPLLSRAFYALKNTRTPMWVSILTVIFSVVIAYPLVAAFSVAGLALAFTIGSYFNAIVLFIFLKKQFPHVLDKELLGSYGKTLFISLIMALLVWGTMHLAAGWVDMNRFFGILEQTVIAIGVGLVSFGLLSLVFDQQEMKWALTRKINGEKPDQTE